MLPNSDSGKKQFAHKKKKRRKHFFHPTYKIKADIIEQIYKNTVTRRVNILTI